MKITIYVFATCFLCICFIDSPYTQVLPKTSVSKKQNLSIRHNENRGGQYLQVSLLQGYWSDNSENNAIFYIKGKRVFFFDHISDIENKKEYLTYWKVSNNKLSFCYSDGLVVTDNIIKLTKDSLVLYRKSIGTSRYVKLK